MSDNGGFECNDRLSVCNCFLYARLDLKGRKHAAPRLSNEASTCSNSLPHYMFELLFDDERMDVVMMVDVDDVHEN